MADDGLNPNGSGDTTSELIQEIDRRSEELLEEFSEHYANILARGHDADKNTVFCGWALQKIASLQVLLSKLCEDPESQDAILEYLND